MSGSVLNKSTEQLLSTSDYPVEVDRKRCKSSDRLTELPDEILVSILSLLKLKEAARTSVLARRWRNLWMHTTGTLDFSYSELDFGKLLDHLFIAKIPRDGKLPLVKIPEFVTLVDKVLSLHQGLTLDEFEVSCNLYGRIRRAFIDEWLEFALRKRVIRLKLDFKRLVPSERGNYSLKKPMLRKYSLDHLKVLCLKKVEVTGKVLQYILSKCHLLEVLRVQGSYSLVELNIPGPLPQLKCVSITQCFEMKYLQICAINIESFTYHGPHIPVTFKENPCLVEASFGDTYASLLVANMGGFASYFSGLESLALNLRYCSTNLTNEALTKFPMLENLRQLDSTLEHFGVEKTMNFCASFLKKCPGLGRFSLETCPYPIPSLVEDWWIKREPKCLHSGVRVVELFVSRCELEAVVACSIVRSLPSIERVILRSYRPRIDELGGYYFITKKADDDEWAKKLEKIMPPGAKLILLL